MRVKQGAQGSADAQKLRLGGETNRSARVVWENTLNTNWLGVSGLEDPFWDEPQDDKAEAREQDPAVESAGDDLRRFFARGRMPYYKSQLEWMMEKKHFHWITYRAMQALLREGYLAEIELPTKQGNNLKFVYRAGLELEKITRHAASTIRVMNKLWEPDHSEVLGKHLEALVKHELRANGLKIVGEHSSRYAGKIWRKTAHDLDFIAETPTGVGLGVEVKNTIPYIPRDEFDVKNEMCAFLGVRPVYAVRWLPKHYIYQAANGFHGFGWLFEHHAYPLGQESLCERLSRRLHYPAKVMTELPPKAQQLFAAWVRKQTP